ncbi:hypothetical protein [Sciscionella sediminilitoris]|uniref:hypothetical protein n=1 Tax=Sciscionella sediminilitoris TaxID=1445613 RepID=UPI0005694B2F|nr:hypothetical protein [Sciscionella sp. SE31]
MVHQGKEFGVDLYELETVAKSHFPTVSSVYGDAKSNCDRAHTGTDSAMRRSEEFGGGSLGPVHKAYSDLHELTVGLLKETQTNLDDTASELDKATKLYAEQDQGAANELHRLEETRGKPKPE